MSAIREQLTQDMKTCMKSGDKPRLNTVRGILAAIKQVEIDTRETPADDQVLSVLNRLVKQRKDALTQYQAANREDLASVEAFELTVIQGYLPQALSDAEVQSFIDAAVAQTGAVGPADMGKVMAVVKAQVAGRADMTQVSALVKARLSS